MTYLLPLAIAGLAFSSCGPRITNANIAVVNKELELAEKQSRGAVSPKEVESILGQPHHTTSTIAPLETQKKELEILRYYYEQDGQTVELHFVDNKLISRVPLFAPKASTPPTHSTP